jgi:hypothetical protein
VSTKAPPTSKETHDFLTSEKVRSKRVGSEKEKGEHSKKNFLRQQVTRKATKIKTGKKVEAHRTKKTFKSTRKL